MYKRYALGESERPGTGPAGVFIFFVFCAVVVWMVPVVLEAVSGHPVELFMVPPIWRAEIMCGSAGAAHTGYTYVYENDKCYKQCKKPGCMDGGRMVDETVPYPVNDGDMVNANLAASRNGIDIHGIYVIVFTTIQYGTVVAALISLGVMNMRSIVYGVPYFAVCGAILYGAVPPGLLWVSVPAWLGSYGADMWSTLRFGRHRIIIYEANPVLRCMVRRCGMRAFPVHTVIYVGLVSAISTIIGMEGPLAWEGAACVMFGLAGAHMWAAANNMEVHRNVR